MRTPGLVNHMDAIDAAVYRLLDLLRKRVHVVDIGVLVQATDVEVAVVVRRQSGSAASVC
jgi:hypothetical protein